MEEQHTVTSITQNTFLLQANQAALCQNPNPESQEIYKDQCVCIYIHIYQMI